MKRCQTRYRRKSWVCPNCILLVFTRPVAVRPLVLCGLRMPHSPLAHTSVGHDMTSITLRTDRVRFRNGTVKSHLLETDQKCPVRRFLKIAVGRKALSYRSFLLRLDSKTRIFTTFCAPARFRSRPPSQLVPADAAVTAYRNSGFPERFFASDAQKRRLFFDFPSSGFSACCWKKLCPPPRLALS